jgi:phosphatidylinositol alpha-1,6-mannosyltransferase
MTAPKSTPQLERIIGLFPELLGVGGVQEAGRLTAAALSEIALRRGWSADFLSINDPPGPHSLAVARRAISIRGFGRAKIAFVVSAIGRVRAAAKDGTSIILAGHPNLAVPADWMQRACPRAKTIVMAHGVEVWKPLPLFRRRALLRANLILAPSRDTVQKLVDVQGVAPEKTRRLAWPLSDGFLRMADAPAGLPVPPAFPQAGPVILTVGRWASSERYKGADELIRAIPQLQAAVPGLHLVAVGVGDDLPRLRELATGLGIAGRVHFLENLSREEVAACYARADFFALPSTGEGFGLVYLEAMAFSKAVVGAAYGGTTDVVEDGVNGLLIPPHDAGALARALGRLLGDEPLRTQLGRRGAEIVRRKYEFGVFQAELERILSDSSLRKQAMA